MSTSVITQTSTPAAASGAPASKLSGMQKAAVLMVILGEDTSAGVLRELDEDEVQRIGREIASIPVITSDMAEDVLSEFYQMLVAQEYVLKGGMDYARKILVNAFGADHARRLLDQVTKMLGSDGASFYALQKADPQQLANFIHNEHPQTIALILSHLGSKHAANLLSSLPIELRADVAMRMANLDQISPEIVAKIASVIGQKLRSLGETSREAYGGVRAVAEMFNCLDPNESKEILESIESGNPQLGETIRHLMFVFEDLIRVDASGIRELLARVDRKVLTVALKGTSDALKAHLFQAMSQRGSEMLKEDMEALGQVKLKEVETAQQQVIAAVRLLESEGVINLGDATSDQYVS
ncbi:MAG TPA: flagellar motor switch protein FliG [Bryobacteraceae bacterium]|nr:flagellar motor switch protein FliG [Bryobacteraceae bacterium]